MEKVIEKNEIHKNAVDNILVKSMSYLVVLIVGFIFLYFCLFKLIPYINLVGINFTEGNMGKIMMYFPSFLIVDSVVFYVAYKIFRFVSKGIISFAEKRFCKN
jgi:hypothetical protein